MKVLHLPFNIGGNALSLSMAERQNNVDSQNLQIILEKGQNKIAYKSDIIYDLSDSNKAKKILKLFKIFLNYRKKYDIYHFNFGASLIHFQALKKPLLELPFYSKNSVKIMTYQGCDARQKYPSMKRLKDKKFMSCFNEECYGGRCNSGSFDKWRGDSIKKASKFCDHIFFVNPDLGHFLPQNKSSFLPYTIEDFDQIKPKEKKDFFKSDTITIGHAPTDRGAKGTKYIMDVLKRLQKNSSTPKIEIILIENKTRKEAMNLYRKCDLIIDQIGGGWYGAVAVEVMKIGVPVLAYLNIDDFKFLEEEMAKDIPIINVNPYSLEKEINILINDKDKILKLSDKSKRYVKKWHNPKTIAEQVIAKYSVLLHFK